MVEGISFSVEKNALIPIDVECDINFISFVREILNQKCEHLDIGENVHTLSGSDIEKLLKVISELSEFSYSCPYSYSTAKTNASLSLHTRTLNQQIFK